MFALQLQAPRLLGVQLVGQLLPLLPQVERPEGHQSHRHQRARGQCEERSRRKPRAFSEDGGFFLAQASLEGPPLPPNEAFADRFLSFPNVVEEIRHIFEGRQAPIALHQMRLQGVRVGRLKLPPMIRHQLLVIEMTSQAVFPSPTESLPISS